MTTITIVDEQKPNKTYVLMCDMQPYQIGRVVGTFYKGEIVMRGSGSSVFSLSDPRVGKHWSLSSTLEVELLDVELIVNIKGN